VSVYLFYFSVFIGSWECLVSAVMSMYTGAKTVVRTVYGNSKCFEVKVCMHQGSALSPLLFVIAMEVITYVPCQISKTGRDRCEISLHYHGSCMLMTWL